MRIMRISLSAVSGLVFATILQATAFAQSPHFPKIAQLSAISTDGSITISFKEAGLGGNTTVTYSIGGNFLAHYGCVNRGGNHPSATNKTGEGGPVVSSVSLPVSKNGTISGSVTFTPPDPNDVLSCPGSQVAVLADISYSGLTLTDQTNGVPATLNSDAEAAIFFTF
jgi:hypothetical protein